MQKLALVLVALIAAATTTNALAAPRTIRLLEKQTFQHYTDKGAEGESPGDIRSFGGTLLTMSHERVGHDRVRCVVAGRCAATIWLTHGSVSATAVVTGPKFTATVTGGTGIYAHAHGTLGVAFGPVTHYVLRLR